MRNVLFTESYFCAEILNLNSVCKRPNLSYCNPVVFKVFFLVTSLKYPPENAPTEAKKNNAEQTDKTNLVKARFKIQKTQALFYSLKMGFLSVHLPASLI